MKTFEVSENLLRRAVILAQTYALDMEIATGACISEEERAACENSRAWSAHLMDELNEILKAGGSS